MRGLNGNAAILNELRKRISQASVADEAQTAYNAQRYSFKNKIDGKMKEGLRNAFLRKGCIIEQGQATLVMYAREYKVYKEALVHKVLKEKPCAVCTVSFQEFEDGELAAIAKLARDNETLLADIDNIEQQTL